MAVGSEIAVLGTEELQLTRPAFADGAQIIGDDEANAIFGVRRGGLCGGVGLIDMCLSKFAL